MSKPSARRAALALVALVVAVGLGTTSVASAAKITMSGGRLFATATSRCQDASAAVTAASTSTSVTAVSVSGLSSACAGSAVTVEVYDPTVTGGWSAAVVATATGTAASGTQVYAAAAFTPSSSLKVRVTIGGWLLPATWSYTPPVTTACTALSSTGAPQPGGSCTITGLSFGKPWGGVGHRQTNGHVNVTSSSPYISFSADLTAGLPANWSWGTSGTVSGGAHYTLTSGYACSSLPILTGTTNPNWSSVDLYVVLYENTADAGSALTCAS